MVVEFTTSYAISAYPAQARCTHTTLCDNICQWFAAGLWFSLGTPVSFTNKTDRHDITEILLKVVLNTISIIINHQVPFWRITIIDKISYLFNIAKIVFLKKWKYWDVVRLQMFIVNNFLRHLFFYLSRFWCTIIHVLLCWRNHTLDQIKTTLDFSILYNIKSIRFTVAISL